MCHSADRAGRVPLAWLLAAVLLVTVVPLPYPEPGSGTAWAKGGGGGQGGGNGQGGGRGGSDHAGSGPGSGAAGGGRGRSADAGPRGRGGEHARPQEFGRTLSALGAPAHPGSAREAARQRYAAATGGPVEARGAASFGRQHQPIDDALTARLVGGGWGGPAGPLPDGFRNHGHRVSSMVEIAKALGYGAHVGALQANFGGPYGTAEPTDDADARSALDAAITALRDELATLADPASDPALALREQLVAHEAELAALDTAPTTGTSWNGDWRTADLDITGDGVVDLADLEAARQLGTVPATAALAPDASEPGDTGEPVPEALP